MNPPYLRRFSVCVLLTAMTATATAQQTPTTAPAGTAPTAGALQTDPAPRVRNLKMAQRVQAPQGHARLLVGVRTLTSAKLVFQITAVKGNRLVKTIRSAELEPAGRVYVIVEATDQRGYQLPAGAYRVRAQATDASGRVSNSIIKGFRVAYDPPVGRLDGAIQPLWPALARSIGQAGQRGQLVAALERFGELYRQALARRFVWRLGLVPRGFAQDMALVEAGNTLMKETNLAPDAFYFNHFGGRGANGAFGDAIKGYETRQCEHPYWSSDGPETMLIQEVEDIWAAIDQHDDWSLLATKIAAVRGMGQALGKPPDLP